MLTINDFHGYQATANSFQLTHKESMLWLGMGLGKTVVTLSTIRQRMLVGQITKSLVVAPLRVVTSVWGQEAAKWAHLQGLSFSKIIGAKKARTVSLFSDKDIYLINYENLAWLSETLDHYFHDKPFPFQLVVYDEITRLKNSTSVGARKWRKQAKKFTYRTGLTGTPASNGYIDLHGQYLMIDDGKRLGPHVTHYRSNYFESDYMGWSYKPTAKGHKEIENAISDITVSMSAAEYLRLPDVSINDIFVELPPKTRTLYDELEKEFFAYLESGTPLEVVNKAGLYVKCLQMANGSVITDTNTREKEAVHDKKLDALSEILEETSTPVLCSYSFVNDAERIYKRFNRKGYRVVNLTKTRAVDLPDIIKQWQHGEIRLAIGHPLSMGHGTDGLQQGCHTAVWFGLPWPLDLYKQFNARIDRQGQTEKVTIHRLLATNTLDIVVAGALQEKDGVQNGLTSSIKNYRNNKR